MDRLDGHFQHVVEACRLAIVERGVGDDDVLEVSVQPTHVGLASLTVGQQARRADRLLAEGTIRVGCVDLGTFRPRRIPEDILARIRGGPQQQANR